MIEKIVLYTRHEKLELPLQDFSGSGIAVTGADGIGPVKATMFMTEYGYRYGGFFRGSRTGSRDMTLNLKPMLPTVEEARNKIYKMLVIGDTVSVRFITDTKDLVIRGYVEGVEPTIFSEDERVVVSVACPSPYWEAYGGGVAVASAAESASRSFEFPFSNQFGTTSLIFGTVLNAGGVTVHNNGEIALIPDITLNDIDRPLSLSITDDRGGSFTITSQGFGSSHHSENFVAIRIFNDRGRRVAQGILASGQTEDISYAIKVSPNGWPTAYPGDNNFTMRINKTWTGHGKAYMSASFVPLYTGV